MKEKVTITGHRNPDTDSICSAIAYADLKNRLGEWEAEPVRLGEISAETRFVLDYFDVEIPRLKTTMIPRIRNINYDKAHGVQRDTSLFEASEIIQKNHLNSIAVVDEKNHLEGVISLSDITKNYANIWADKIIGQSQTSLENILHVLSAQVLVQPEKARDFSGSFKVYAMSHEYNDLIKENDLVLAGNRYEAQKDAIERGVSLLVLTNNTELAEDLIPLAEKKGVTIISTGFDTFIASRLIPQAVPVSHVMTREDLVYFHDTDMIDQVQKSMAKSRFRSFPVLNAKNEVIGAISRYHLINYDKGKLILVDHNEPSQSIRDLSYAQIIEIVDHHRIDSITTDQPIYFRNMPVGSTATIVAKLYEENQIEPSPQVAGLLCSAIISDTLLFRSPTSTQVDKDVLEKLAPIAGIDPEEYAREMFRVGTDISNKKPSELLNQDVKFYNIHNLKVKIAQVFTVNLESLKVLEEDLIGQMKEFVQTEETDTYILSITDMFGEVSRIIVIGEAGEEIASEFGADLEKHSFMAPGVLSRKKQILPLVTKAIQRHIQ